MDNETKLLHLMEMSKYPIVQENGQRRYGPPPDWVGLLPEKGCEAFVGKICRDLFEDELVPGFSKIGKIYMLRLVMDFSGSNRGYYFITYTCREHAQMAIQFYNNYEIRHGRFLGVCTSVDNCKLFVGGIPKDKVKDEIIEAMREVTDGVKDVIVYSNHHDKSKNRGFAFVEHETHRAAAMARRKLIPGSIQLFNHQIAVDWAEPEVKVLHVRNLSLVTSEDTLRDLFTRVAVGERGMVSGAHVIERVKKVNDFAFVHFTTRDSMRALSTILGRLDPWLSACLDSRGLNVFYIF